MNEKKKILIVLLVVALIIIFFTINIIIQNKNSEKYYKTFTDTIAKESKQLIVIGKEDCQWCQLFIPSLDYMKEKYKFDYTYIDIEKLNKNHKTQLFEKLELEDTEDFGTPHIVVFENNQKQTEHSGYMDEGQLLEYLKENEFVEEKEQLPINYIDYNQYEELINKNENQLIVIGQTTCTYCIQSKPILNKIIDQYGIKINFINYDELDEDQIEKFTSSLTFFQENEFGTPLMIVVKNKEVIDNIEGLATQDNYIQFFKNNGFIK